MPVCAGLSTGPCPDQRNDSTVSMGEGDLLLCRSCNAIREQEFIDKMIAEGKLPTGTTRSSATSVKTRSHKRRNEHDDKTTSPSPVVVSNSSISNNRVHINELLAYMVHYRDCSNANNLRRSVLDYYTAVEINEAKNVMVNLFQMKLEGNQLIVDRRDSAVRQAHVAEVDDIIGIVDFLDEKNCLSDVLFVAAKLDRLPKFGPEELNTCSIVNQQAKIGNVIEKLAADIDDIKKQQHPDFNIDQVVQSSFNNSMVEIQRSIDNIQSSLNSRIDHLNTLCAQIGSSIASSTAVAAAGNTITSQTPQPDINRSMNIIVFGIAENTNISVWRASIDDIFTFIVSREIVVADAFRLGKYADDKIRPVLVKLNSAWDKRVILRGSWKLKGHYNKVFVVPDEPLDVRRQQTWDRIKRKAEMNGKNVSVIEGNLCIDGVATFSLSRGFLVSRNV